MPDAVLVCYVMLVTFTRTGKRRVGFRSKDLYIEPAPGYDDRLRHDAAHFIVENELPILNGIFGQIAAGGAAKSFRPEKLKKSRRKKRQGQAMAKPNREDMLLSERAVYAANNRWEKPTVIPDTKVQDSDLARLISAFESFSEKWQKLEVDDSMSLEWKPSAKPRSKRR